MLDVHATTGTSGNAVITTALTTIAVGDGSPVAGVPIRSDAVLVSWGAASVIADTLWGMKLESQDSIDPINGEYVSLSATCLKNLAYKLTCIPYKTGQRRIYVGTNTAGASLAFTKDWYNAGTSVMGSRVMQGQVVLPQLLNADVANTWTTTGLAPATAIPNGRYALLGAYCSLMTESHLLRFAHADFSGFKPGFPTVDHSASAINGWQKGMDDRVGASPLFQFAELSELTGKPCCPVFTVSNAGTGLNIESLCHTATDTPKITLNIAKVG